MTTPLAENVWELLRHYGVEHPNSFRGRLEIMTEGDAQAFLDEYRGLYLVGDHVRLADPIENRLSIWPDHVSTHSLMDRLRVWSLWVNRVYVADPILPLTHHGEGLGSQAPLKERIGRGLSQLHELFPLVKVGYVDLTGVPIIREPPEQLPRALDPGDEMFDPRVREIALGRIMIAAGVAPESTNSLFQLEHLEDFVHVARHAEIDPTDILMMRFDQDGDSDVDSIINGMVYGWVPQEEVDKLERGVVPKPRLSGEHIPREYFEPWLDQQLRIFTQRRVVELQRELVWASALGAEFVTPSAVNIELATLQGVPGSVPVLQPLQELGLPGLSQIPIPALAELLRDIEAVDAFRQVLRHVLRDITSVPGSPVYQQEMREARRHLEESIVALERDLKRGIERFGLDAGLAIIIAAVGGLFGGWPAVLALGALALAKAGVQGVYDHRAGSHTPLAIYHRLLEYDNRPAQNG